MSERVRRRYHVRGVVQGVGFRPFVFNLARALGLSGHVGNDSSGVFIEAEGSPEALAQFEHALHHRPPPLAQVRAVVVESLTPLGEREFRILESRLSPAAATLVSPDIAICEDCLRELFDPRDRRYRYPFINCTQCGPRFTIITALPYDRPNTTMASFAMCAQCSAEYHDPADRRFHAQPIACAKCGPRLWMEHGDERYEGEAAIDAAQRLLLAGAILAVKGIGGFHLACDARSEAAVQHLRTRKGRAEKPFAVMARDLEVVRAFAHVDEEEAAHLLSRERPIVLLRKRMDATLKLAEGVAPRNAWVGVMLPYAPLHYLLLDGALRDVPLVMTSGNVSETPIAKDNDEARQRLKGIAQAWLLHDRPIHMRCDDSVMRHARGSPILIRRSRGYAPLPIELPISLPPVLAVGGDLKNAFCLTREAHAFLSQHIGDLEDLDTLRVFEATVSHFMRLFAVQPSAVACDLHPGYHATRWARQWAAAHHLPLIKVQHHHAHIAACLAEHGRDPEARVIGFSFDGTGYGADGAIWGGEVLLASMTAFERVAHLRYVPLPGGDAAIRRPYRIALAHLWAAQLPWDEDLPCVRACPPEERRVLAQQLARGVHCALTSSMGRLFDAVASLLDMCHHASYEGQAAMQLESEASIDNALPYPFAIEDDETLRLDVSPMMRAIVADWRAGVERGAMASRFHATLVAMMRAVASRLRAVHALNTIALSGGVFQNAVLLNAATSALRADGFEVLIHRQVPPNDGGLALGQALIAAHRLLHNLGNGPF
ncbi:MAG: carbamoyltransferase HypF [Thermoflexales bacterium]|nr:carbamoyltransferase HypF [Thermoflexales bacterium]